MADRVVERTETQVERPRDTVVVDRDTDRHGSNVGVIVAIVLLVLVVLLLVFGRGIFSSGGSTKTPVTSPSTSSGQ